jgi:rfaE bifunctional protein nucleotidyltransferase chain/domain
MSDTKTVLVGGCFDLLHYGHIVFLKKAKSFGDKLIVALEADENVRKMKGPTRPIHNQNQRALMLETLKVVDQIIKLPPMLKDQDYADLVKRVKPNVIAVTEGDPSLSKKTSHAQNVGAKIEIIAKVKTPSTSQLAKLLGLE